MKPAPAWLNQPCPTCYRNPGERCVILTLVGFGYGVAVYPFAYKPHRARAKHVPDAPRGKVKK